MHAKIKVNISTDSNASVPVSNDEKILIVYFSVMETDGVDTVSGTSRIVQDGEVYGNTEYVAKIIQSKTNGDLFQIQTKQEYPSTHQPLLEFAHKEMEENVRLQLSSSISNIDEYTTIYLGYPKWNADFLIPLYTFLEEYDLDGKKIILF